MKRICLLNLVGLTPRLAVRMPRIAELASRHGIRPFGGAFPAVTCTAQASILTGAPPSVHGAVGNGWLFRETREVRFWQQARALLGGETLIEALRARDPEALCANLFWWFNLGSGATWSLTPRPWYGCDGDKRFDVSGTPDGFAAEMVGALGPFPFASFWGPAAGAPSSRWIAAAAARTLTGRRPHLTLVYLPHLDYGLQRHGASEEDPALAAALREADACAGTVIDAARAADVQIVVLSEYGLRSVRRPVFLNRALREAGLLVVRDGPFGEHPDLFASRAFAVADHQIAHLYVRDRGDEAAVDGLLRRLPGVAALLDADGLRARGLDHPRSGERVVLAEPDAWFAYPFWLDDRNAPDYARTVDIHRKPGYDPCELLLDPALRWPRLRLAVRLLQKRAGLRTRFDVVPLDASLVRGSHGLPPERPDDGPALISSHAEPPDGIGMEGLKAWVLAAMEGQG